MAILNVFINNNVGYFKCPVIVSRYFMKHQTGKQTKKSSHHRLGRMTDHYVL